MGDKPEGFIDDPIKQNQMHPPPHRALDRLLWIDVWSCYMVTIYFRLSSEMQSKQYQQNSTDLIPLRKGYGPPIMMKDKVI